MFISPISTIKGFVLIKFYFRLLRCILLRLKNVSSTNNNPYELQLFKMIYYQKVRAFMWLPEANLFPIATYTMLN